MPALKMTTGHVVNVIVVYDCWELSVCIRSEWCNYEKKKKETANLI